MAPSARTNTCIKTVRRCRHESFFELSDHRLAAHYGTSVGTHRADRDCRQHFDFDRRAAGYSDRETSPFTSAGIANGEYHAGDSEHGAAGLRDSLFRDRSRAGGTCRHYLFPLAHHQKYIYGADANFSRHQGSRRRDWPLPLASAAQSGISAGAAGHHGRNPYQRRHLGRFDDDRGLHRRGRLR